MFMRNVGVLSLLVYDMLCNTKHAIQSMQYKALRTQSFFIFFFLQKEPILPSFLDVLSVVSCSLREWSASQQ